MKAKKLEMFFFGCPRIVGLQNFPHLKKLCIMNQKIGSMAGIRTCPSLEELWVCEGEIEVSSIVQYKKNFIHNLLFLLLQHIEGLEGCPNLQHLLLYTNRISCMEGINHLSKLQRLWLNGNRITCVEVSGEGPGREREGEQLELVLSRGSVIFTTFETST